MKKNRILAVVLALVIAMAAALSLVGCGDRGETYPDDNSFEGFISEQSYDSKDEAATAFLSTEISGQATTATFVSYTKSADLTETEIAALKLGDEISVEDVEAAESGNVAYTEGESGVLTSADAGQKTVRVYMIKIGGKYFYYVPIFKRGELITKSYISDILDYKKYINVTETTTAKSTVSAAGQSMSTTLKSVVKVADDAMYAKIETTMFGMSLWNEMYIFNDNGNLKSYFRSSDDLTWTANDTLEYSSVEDFIENMFKFDHTYFEKTASGFKLTNEKLMSYINDVLESVDADMGVTINSGNAEYYVKDGKLDSVNVKIVMSMTTEAEGQKMTISTTATNTVTYTNYGTTVITVPDDLPVND